MTGNIEKSILPVSVEEDIKVILWGSRNLVGICYIFAIPDGCLRLRKCTCKNAAACVGHRKRLRWSSQAASSTIASGCVNSCRRLHEMKPHYRFLLPRYYG